MIGSGGIARRRTIPEGILRAPCALLHGVYDANRTINEQVASRFQTRCFDGLDRLRASGIDAVYVATPAHRHEEHVLAAAR